MPTPLAPPALPEIEERVRWPRAIAVFGPSAAPFASVLAEALGARLVRIELRHAEGDKRVEETVHCHPSALSDVVRALKSEARDGYTVGVGSAFALAVEADLTVCITGPAGTLALAPAERRLVRASQLVLELPRAGTARALAERLARGL